MEKKKLLLVAVSVGVFLVIVIAAAILVFSPRPGNAVITMEAPQNAERSASVDASAMMESPDLRGLQDPALVSPIQENKIYINGDGVDEVTLNKTENALSTKTVITIPKPDAAVNEPAIKKADAIPARRTDRGEVKPRRENVPAASAAPAKKLHNDFWVQAGSFSSRERADTVKRSLGEKGITAIITNQDVSGKTYFRVRVGPYTTRNEAEYWLAMISSIDGFRESQIWQSQSRR